MYIYICTCTIVVFFVFFCRIVRECRQACDLSPDHESSDDERTATPTNQFNEEDYLRMLKEHKKKRRMKMVTIIDTPT